MKRVVTTEQMKRSDSAAIEQMKMPGLVLMERAALAVVQKLQTSGFDLSRVCVVCGSGNNGGDGIAIARLLKQAGVSTEIFDAAYGHRRTESNLRQLEIAKNYKVPFCSVPDFKSYTTIIDAVFGVGLSRQLGEEYIALFQKINRSGADVAAVDIPSGINGDTGELMGAAVRADLTVTFAFAKPGLLLFPGAEYAGKLVTTDIGIYEHPSVPYIPEIYHMDASVSTLLPKRRIDGNKGTFGKVLLVAGSYCMSGAAYLSAKACYYAGAGMVKLLTHESNRQILQQQLPEALMSCYGQNCNFDELLKSIHWADVIGIGPGLGTTETAEAIVQFIMTNCDKPMVLDADGLNLVSKNPTLLKHYKGGCVITPHMGEMSRLCGQSISQIAQNRMQIAGNFAEEFGCVCVLKDARTIIAKDAFTFFINTAGNSGMATAGSGDVLTGIMLAMLAGTKNTAYAALLAVWFHACAGDVAAKRYGTASLMAGMLIDAVSEVMKQIEYGE